TLDVIGAEAGSIVTRPQDVLGQYDIVFAKARCALEALAVGSAVVLCDTVGVGPMVTSGEVDQLRRLNFGVRTLQGNVHPDVLEKEIARYDAADATEVSRRIRDGAGREAAIDQILALYEDVVSEFEVTARDSDAEARAEAVYLQQLALHLEQQRNVLLNSQTFRLRQRLVNLPLVGSLFRSLARKL
ncbi:MAG TPA: hypothetical protein VJS13_15820, partial [Pyrinomonadaceae bacterium]|nr:hypothetical protein [Pyrinomonadaceae bacterium]